MNADGSPQPHKVLLLENVHYNAEAFFHKRGFEVERLSTSLTEDELCERIKDLSFIGIRSKTYITPRVLENAHKLLAIGAFCIGTNQIDLAACSDKGVPVFNAPFSNTRSVVELVLAEIILLARRIPDKDRAMHQGFWKKSSKGSHEVRGKTLGIVGYGNIGSQLSVIAEALGMNVCFFDKVDKLALGNATRCASLNELLGQSDFVSLHVDGDALNQKMFGRLNLDAMKPGAILLNLSRGFVIDIPALSQAIKSGHLGGASVDVFPAEPKTNDEAFLSELAGLPNVILTPHIGGSTSEAQVDIAATVPLKLLNYLRTGSSFSSVNFPNLQLPDKGNSHRLLHIHRNQPGIIAKLNSTLAKNDINIVGQYLKTDEKIGYVITDIDKEYDHQVLEELEAIEATIKMRVLY